MYRHEFQEGSICAFWGHRIEDGITISRYHRTETRTPFDIHWTKNGRYFQFCSDDVQAVVQMFHDATKPEPKFPHFIA